MSSPKTTDWTIRDAAGTVVAIHRRTELGNGRKRFSWLLPDGTTSSGQICAADVPLYRAETLAVVTLDAPAIVAEGEKATDALARHGFAAVGTVTGAPAAPGDVPLSALTGRDVVLWPDHDDVGRKQMARVAERLAGVARSVRVIAWGEEDGDDAHDYFARGGTVDGCRALVDAAIEPAPVAIPSAVDDAPAPTASHDPSLAPTASTSSAPARPRFQSLAERITEVCKRAPGKILALFSAHGVTSLKPNGPDGWYKGYAEWHGTDKDPAFGVHPSTGSWCDHRNGDVTGGLLEFLTKFRHMTEREAAMEACRRLEIEWREESPKEQEARIECDRAQDASAMAIEHINGDFGKKTAEEVLNELGTNEDLRFALACLRVMNLAAFFRWIGTLRPKNIASRVEQVIRQVEVPRPSNGVHKDEEHAEVMSRVLAGLSRGKRGSINIGDGDMERHRDESIVALRAENAERIKTLKFADALFMRGDVLHRISLTEFGVPVPQVAKMERVRNRLADCVAYYTERVTDEGPKAIREYPPKDIALSILHQHGSGFPELESVMSHPVIVLEDGSPRVIAREGYDSRAKLLLHGFSGDVLPTETTREEGVESARWIRTEVLHDFPFAGPSEVSHAYGLIFLPFVRTMIDGCTPFHLVEGSSKGAGKGLLTDVCASFSIAQGARILVSPVKEDEEWRKRITTIFGIAAEMVTIDNMTGKVDSPTLAALFTTRYWTDRALGTSTPVRYRNDVIWTATANNLTLDEDIARRVVRIRLEPQCDNPSLRKSSEFRHADIERWMLENRDLCLRHAWTCVLSWVQAGCPMADTPPMGSFRAWSRVIGSLLAWLEIDGFLNNRADVQTVSVSDAAMLSALVHVWWERYSGSEVTSEQLLEIADEVEFPIRGESDRERRLSVCWSIRRLRGRWIDGLHVVYLPQNHAVRRNKSTFKLTKREAF